MPFRRAALAEPQRVAPRAAVDHDQRVSAACPRCNLPKEELAWQCDGCGYAFRKDFDAVRSELQAALKTARVRLWVSVLVGVVIGAVIVLLAMHGFIYISVPVALAVVASIGSAAHRISVVRDHLRSLRA